MLPRRDTPRIRTLLRELEDAHDDLDAAASPEQAACAREEIAALQHSLWLAGYEREEIA